MSKTTRSSERRNKIGPRIVRAWFDTVINPLIHSLEGEQELLNEKNWTWRFRPVGLESQRPVRAHIDPEARDNLEQLIEFYPDIKKAVEEHDKKVPLLLEKCKQLHQVIEESRELREIYERGASPESLSEMGLTLVDLFGAYPQLDHLALLAQYIVNNTGDLPAYYSPARLWNKYRSEFIAILDHPAIRSDREATIKAGDALLRSVERLIRLLKEMRLQLSLEHDVPYVVATSRFNIEAAGEGL